MSRIGRQPIKVPNSVKIVISEDGRNLVATGSLGELSVPISSHCNVTIDKDNTCLVTLSDEKFIDNPEYKAMWGLTRALINNAIIGVSEGFKKELEIRGIGYRAQMSGDDIIFSLGYSHQITFKKVDGVSFSVTDNTHVFVSGISKELVGEVSARIRKLRKPEPYKGKGVRYKDEVVRKKISKGTKAKK